MRAIDLDIPLIGHPAEKTRVVAAIQKQQPLLVLGDRGSGKTKLIRTAIEESQKEVIFVPWSPILHDFLVAFANALLSARHSKLMQMARISGNTRQWLTAQSSVHLKGILWTAIESEPVRIVLDGIDGAGAKAYRFVQRIYHTKGVSVIAASRDVRALDMLGRLFWDPRLVLSIPALSAAESAQLFDALIARLRIEHLEISEFRSRALEAARGNPGQIVEMCRLAADPKYWSGRHILFAPLRIDAYTRVMA